MLEWLPTEPRRSIQVLGYRVTDIHKMPKCLTWMLGTQLGFSEVQQELFTSEPSLSLCPRG